MFKVIENPDGSTTVFSRETGKVVCVVPQRKIRNTKPLGISHPIPRMPPAAASTSHQPQDAATLPTVSAQNIAASPVVSPRKIIFDDHDVNTDYSEDCITNEQFMQTLGLISTEKLKQVPRNKLLLEFPYRDISKTDCKEFYVPPDVKLFDGADICTLLGEKWLKVEHVSTRYNIKDEQVPLVCINKYSQFCKTSPSRPENSTNIPKLRCREEKEYPLTFRPGKMWGNGRHMYSFNRQQRLERLKIIKTGLNKRGRRLLRTCKPLSIKIKRLTKKEIDKWTRPNPLKLKVDNPEDLILVQAYFQKKLLGRPFKTPLPQHPGIKPMITCPNRYFPLRAHYPAPMSDIATSWSRNVSKKPSVSNTPFSCHVMLRNVLQRLVQTPNACYVGYTIIKVKDVILLPWKLWQSNSTALKTNTQKRIQKVVPYNGNMHNQFSNSTSALNYRMSSQSLAASARFQSHLNIRAIKSDVQAQQSMSAVTFPKGNAESSKFSQRMLPCRQPQQPIQVIDITSDDEEEASSKAVVVMPKPAKYAYLFHCFGCGIKSAYENSLIADNFIRKHVVEYHYVSTPELFLKYRTDDVHQSVLVEAFPSFNTSKS